MPMASRFVQHGTFTLEREAKDRWLDALEKSLGGAS